MKRSLLIFCLLFPWSFNSFGDEAPPGMRKFNMNCPARKLCPELDSHYQLCKNNPNSKACLKYIGIFKKLIPTYDCQRSYDHTSTKDYIVPAFWLCDKEKLWDYIELLSKLDDQDAQEFFASSDFRSILDGELAEGFHDMSLNRESVLKYKGK